MSDDELRATSTGCLILLAIVALFGIGVIVAALAMTP